MNPSLPNPRHGPVSKWRRWILKIADLSSTLCHLDALPHLEKLLFASRQLAYLHYRNCLPWLQRQICSWMIALSLAFTVAESFRVLISIYFAQMPLSSHGCYRPSTNSPNRSIVWGTRQRSDIPLCQSLQTPCRRRLHSRSRRIPEGSNTASECFRHVQVFQGTCGSGKADTMKDTFAKPTISSTFKSTSQDSCGGGDEKNVTRDGHSQKSWNPKFCIVWAWNTSRNTTLLTCAVMAFNSWAPWVSQQTLRPRCTFAALRPTGHLLPPKVWSSYLPSRASQMMMTVLEKLFWFLLFLANFCNPTVMS